MKALSIRQPWAWAILHAGKNIENRTWFQSFRGRIVIHAGKSIDKLAVQLLRAKGYDVPINLPTGALVGEVTITGCVNNHHGRDVDSEWAEPGYCFTLADPKPYDNPIPYTGKLGFFKIEKGE